VARNNGTISSSERAAELGRLGGGRPRKPRASEIELQTLKERLEPHIEATVERLVELSQSKDESVSLRACNTILDRYYGKPCEAAAPADSNDGRGFTTAGKERAARWPLVESERMMGLEPTTFCMASRRSSQLSYIRAERQV
jgi:hypothetical protein